MVRRVLAHEPPCIGYLLDAPEHKAVLEEIGEALGAVQAMAEAGDHAAAARRFFDDLVLLPWDDIPPATQRMIEAHALTFVGQLRDPDALVVEPEGLSGLDVPVLLSEGSTSHAFFHPVADQLAAGIPDVHRVVLRGTGHVPQMTHPQQYAQMVRDFISS